MGVRRRQAQEVVVAGARRFLVELFAFGAVFGAVLLKGCDGSEETAFFLF